MFLRLILVFLALVWATSSPAGDATYYPLSDVVWASMQGKSYRAKVKGCAQRADLVLVRVPYWDYAGKAQSGYLILHKTVAADVLDIFTALYTDKSHRFARIQLIDDYGGDDLASMAANNTSAYNCRAVAGGKRLSSHARGLAIDINPLTNPFVGKSGTSPPGATAFDTPKERKAAKNQPGIIMADSPITKAFKAKGWGWGGDWKTSKDYQHFSADGK